MNPKTLLLSLALLAPAALSAQTSTPTTAAPPASQSEQKASPPNNTQTQTAPALPPCEATKPLTAWERAKLKIKQHIEHTAVIQAATIDATIAKDTHGRVDTGAADTTATAAAAANQPKPCVPVPDNKGLKPAKQ